MKYRPGYPQQAFETLLAARRWVGQFVQWHNHEHRPVAINFVMPDECHAGLHGTLLSRRAEV